MLWVKARFSMKDILVFGLIPTEIAKWLVTDNEKDLNRLGSTCGVYVLSLIKGLKKIHFLSLNSSVSKHNKCILSGNWLPLSN